MNNPSSPGPAGPRPPAGSQRPRLPGGAPGSGRPNTWFTGRGWLVALIVLVAFNLIFYAPLMSGGNNNPTVTLPYTTFLSEVRANQISTANVSSTDVNGNFRTTYHDPSNGKTYTRYTAALLPVTDPNLVPTLTSHSVKVTGTSTTTPLWLDVLSLVLQSLPLLFLLGLFYFGTRAARSQQQGIFGFGQSRAKLYTEERPSTTFADVAGVESAKSELREEVDFLRNPTKYQQLGARIPKGVLLVGPPGTGKTLLARAVAGEARVPFLSISATEFIEMFVGVGASRVRDLFEKAKASAPAIIFIDEIDSIGRRRGGIGPMGGGGNDEREQTLNQLLVAMDGFEPNQAVIVLAATNRPDVLDPALLRPGRFDRQVVLDPPDRTGREAILRIHTRHIPLGGDVNLGAIARATPGMSGADLANLANEAALTAARQNRTTVNQADFEEALDRITLGAPGAALMNEDERRTVAYHEGGHALVAYLLPGSDPLHRVTITPRGRSLGVTQFRPIDDRRNYRRDYLMARIAVGLGGRTAEEIACDEITSGAQNDLQQVTRIARTMVTQLGMAPEIGPEFLGGDSAGLDGNPYAAYEPREYSEETARRIDEAVARLIEEGHRQAHDLLSGYRPALDALANVLVRDESLSAEQIATVVQAAGAPPPQRPLATADEMPQAQAS